MSKSVKIFTCHHKESAFLKDAVFQPIHVGKANNPNDIGCPGDDTGDNISFKNPYYCELTAHYWMWKNAGESDYLGLMHYRRHLSFQTETELQEDNWGVVVDKEINDAYQKKHGLNEQAIKSLLTQHDVLLPKQWDVRKAGSRDNYDHYRKSQDLFIEDYQAAIDVLLKQHPEYYGAVKEYNESPFGYYTNMFVMKRGIFEQYSEWLFGIMRELEEVISLQNYTQQQCRVFGHISERLLGIYFTHHKSEWVIKELQRTFVQKESFNGGVKPWFSSKNHPIVICFDDNYAHSGGALIQSIIKNTSPDKNYDILILENGVSLRNKERLLKLVESRQNVYLRFFNVNAFDEIKHVHTRAHFSPATYARLFIPKIFTEQQRVLFIDADTVVNDDVAKLFQTELGDNLIAAVKDIVMEGFVKFRAISDHHTGALEAGEYLRKYLGMKNPDGYFQAGLILFNLEQMREENTYSHLINVLTEKVYWFLDQDIMNKVFEGRVHFLPLNWNVFHGNGNTYEFFPGLKFSTFSRFLKARKAPSMVHFAGDQKPWDNPAVDFAELYWNALGQTPWYEERVKNLITKRLKDSVVLHESPVVRLSKEERFRRFLKPYLKNLLPTGSRRLRKASLAYFRLLSSYRNLVDYMKKK
jgi:lipopolysaccharide biosynthesis glycosyltransferase